MALTQTDEASSRRALLHDVSFARAWPLTLPLLLGGGTVWLAFRSGGFFAGETAIAVIVAGLALVLWMMLAPRPFQALTVPLAVTCGSLALFAGWTLLSQRWSDAPARAVLESNRTLLYLLVVVLFGLAASLRLVRENVPRFAVAALAVVSICALITRLLPDTWPIADTIEFGRLSYPTSYWNTEGMLAALALVGCVHFAASGNEAVAVRALAAAAAPPVAAALLLTFSRGAIAAFPIGLLALLLLGRHVRIASALAAIVPTVAVAVIVVYQTDGIVNASVPDPTLLDQGRTVALYIAVCGLCAAVLVVALRSLDQHALRLRPRAPWQSAGLATGLVAVIIAAGVVAEVPQRVGDVVDRLGHVQQPTAETGDVRSHLTSISDSGRADQYYVAVHAFDRHPIIGAGAGTYPLLYSQDRKTMQTVNDGHSLYLETMAELGLVGLVLIVAAIAGLLAGALMRIRSGREAGALAFALTLMWALRAGFDWDWEMPALTLPVLAVAAAALYVPGRRGHSENRSWPNGLPRLLIGLALLAALITPLAIVRSQAQLNDAVAAMRDGRCGPAISSALSSSDALSIRPEPFQVLALCDLRIGQRTLALNAISAALRRDPENWRLLYNRAIIRATMGLDPRPGLRAALRRNPRSTFLADAVALMDTSSRAQWRKRSAKALVLE